MKILLVACNAKYIHSNLAVYDLQAYASDYADHIVLKEYTINQQKDDIMRDIYLEHPDVVCVSCYIWNLSFVKELIADLIKILPTDLPRTVHFVSEAPCFESVWIFLSVFDTEITVFGSARMVAVFQKVAGICDSSCSEIDCHHHF